MPFAPDTSTLEFRILGTAVPDDASAAPSMPLAPEAEPSAAGKLAAACPFSAARAAVAALGSLASCASTASGLPLASFVSGGSLLGSWDPAPDPVFRRRPNSRRLDPPTGSSPMVSKRFAACSVVAGLALLTTGEMRPGAIDAASVTLEPVAACSGCSCSEGGSDAEWASAD